MFSLLPLHKLARCLFESEITILLSAILIKARKEKHVGNKHMTQEHKVKTPFPTSIYMSVSKYVGTQSEIMHFPQDDSLAGCEQN